ncbi:OmpP1/FadL family transporter [Croceivirga sp. JEA036]|uniref:OmpP1/FadL family transporter n=1 Tax=Croceivirga sp. JEA036 TaxID=2721162 RepID=UPI00143C7795|nr:outer membrane protein transport protein [Croceivirga sp. JEA036]NJB37367.1 aromatic hydrocarbon degradation protein [Croceivirga sp. JEA036]
MKRILTLILGLACLSANAQNINDVLRLGLEESQGTARYQAMGGAFGALGGDLSSLNSNPAGSAIFNYGQFAISGSNYNRSNDQGYGSSFNNTTLNSVELNQVGGVFVFNSQNPNSNWKKMALAVNYDLVDSFDNEYRINGNSTTGVDQYFLGFANGVPFGSINYDPNSEFVDDVYLEIGELQNFGNQQAFLGYAGGLISPADPDNPDGESYLSNTEYSQVNQRYLQSTAGYNSKFTLNFSGQYQENLYLGASLNFHSVLFERFTQLDEDGYITDSPVNFSSFDNLLQTEGNGFSFSLGAIAKLNDNIRVGGSYQSPTWYYLNDNLSQQINSNLADSEIRFINFNLINFYEDYTIQTPSKVTGSAAIVFGKDGLLSFDYSHQDFSKAELRPNNDPVFEEENTFIASELGAVNSYKLGGEYRIERLSLRGGYQIIESPYADKQIMDDLSGYSAGLGYDFGGSKLDLSFVHTEQDMDFALLDAASNTAASTFTNTNVTLTYTLKF